MVWQLLAGLMFSSWLNISVFWCSVPVQNAIVFYMNETRLLTIGWHIR